MYKEICDFAKKHKLEFPVKHHRYRDIAGYIVLNALGEYDMIEKLDKAEKKMVPDFQNPNICNIVCEQAGYIFNLADDSGKNQRKYRLWFNKMLEGAESCDSMATVCDFLLKYDSDEDFRDAVLEDAKNSGLKDKDYISFMIDGVCLEDLESEWGSWFQSMLPDEKSDMIYSSMSGEYQTACPDTNGPYANIFGTKLPIASANNDSYESYGFDKASGLQIGLDDANRIAAFFNFAASDENYSNKDFQLVYFYSKDVENIISESMRIDVSEDCQYDIDTHKSLVSEMLTAVKTGHEFVTKVDDNAEYYMFQLLVNGDKVGRYCFAEKTGKYQSLVENLYKWYSDTSLEVHGRVITIRKIYNVLMSCCSLVTKRNASLSDICDHTNSELGGLKTELLSVVYEGHQIPHVIYSTAVSRMITAISCSGITKNDSKESKDEKDMIGKVWDQVKIYKSIWLQIIKCYLIRKGYEIMPGEVNTINTAYACGQLFAVYEDMQYQYFKTKGDLNRNLAQGYFPAALKQPSVIFPQLASLAVVYLNKIEHPGIYTRKLGELSELIGTAFPKNFTDDEKGSFILGYYQQKAEVMKAIAAYKAKNEAENADNTTESEGE